MRMELTSVNEPAKTHRRVDCLESNPVGFADEEEWSQSTTNTSCYNSIQFNSIATIYDY